MLKLSFRGRRSLIVSGLGLLAGCGGGDDDAPPDDTRAQKVSFAPLGEGRLIGNPATAVDPSVYGVPPFDQPRLFVFKYASSLEDFWRAGMQSRFGGAPVPLPAVDFSRQRVAAVFLGWRSNGCHDVLISDVRLQEDYAIVRYQEVVPGVQGTGCTSAIVYPSRLIVMDQTRSVVAFEEGPLIHV